MLFPDEDDDQRLDPTELLAALHGAWRDEDSGTTSYVRVHEGYAIGVYCEGGHSELSGMYTYWQVRRGALYGYFRGRTSGMFVLQQESPDSLVGGWWLAEDLPRGLHYRLPFLPGVHPCRWLRQDPRRPWPGWATRELRLPSDGSVTSESLAPPPSTRALERSAEGRYRLRVAHWTGGRGGLARLGARILHHGWWLAHNLIVHPLLALSQGPRALALHDWTSRRLNLAEQATPSPSPVIERRLWWIVHNLVAHPAIGLLPCATTFRWHDSTARRMQVHGWA